MAADFILILFGLLLFLVASFRFFSLWSDDSADRWAFGLFLVFAGFSFTPFNYFSTNDLLSTGFLILVITEASFGLKERKRSLFVIAGFALFAALFFKFSFYPFVGIVPAGLVLLSLIRRDREPIKFLGYFAIPVLLCFLALFAAFPNHVLPPSGDWITGWYWQNLKSQDPFGAKALFFIDFLLRRLDSAALFGFVMLGLIHAFSIGISATIIYISGVYLKQKFGSEDYDGRTLSVILGVATIGTVVAYLIWLSLRLPTFDHPIFGPWTFVQETRYYGPAMVLLIFAVFVLPLHFDRGRYLIRGASLALVVAVTSYAIAYWGYKNYDYFVNERIEGSFAGVPSDDAAVAEFLKNDRTLDRGSTVLGFISHAAAYGYPTLLIKTDPAKFPFPWFDWHVGSTPINTSQPRTLLVTIHKAPTDADQAMLNQYESLKILELKTYDLYRLEILP